MSANAKWFIETKPGHCVECHGLLDNIDLQEGNDSHCNLWNCIHELRAENEALRERVKELREYIDPLEYAELKAGLAADNAD